MTTLKDALPYLVLDLESALAHIGRGNVVDQLRDVSIVRWTYDALGINLDIDSQGRLTGMEILGGKAIVSRLEETTAE